jgi:hypothetical protein
MTNLIQSSNFIFSKNKFIAEKSALGTSINLGVAGDETADELFTIIYTDTGKELDFALETVECEEDDSDSVLSWNFVCITPGSKDQRAVIFNEDLKAVIFQ